MAQKNEKVNVWGDSHQGRVRPENEDVVLFVGPLADHKGYLLAVADGVSGQQGGKLASQTLIHELRPAYEATKGPDVAENLRAAIQTANFRAAQQCQGSGGASTLVAAVIAEGYLYLANVGDSRAYLIRNGQAFQLSRDHAAAGGVITRALVADFNAQPDIYPPYPLQAGDRLLLCSDGLHDLAPDPAVLARLAGRGAVQPAVINLINWANQQGGPDNIAAVVAHFRPAPAGWPWVALALILCLLLAGGLWAANQIGDTPTETPAPTSTIAVPAASPTPLPPSPSATAEPPTIPPTATPTPSSTPISPFDLSTPTVAPTSSPTAPLTPARPSPIPTSTPNNLATLVATFISSPPSATPVPPPTTPQPAIESPTPNGNPVVDPIDPGGP